MNPTETQMQNQDKGGDGQNQSERAERWGERGFITPPANITATDNEYLIELDMPGVDRAGLELTVEGDELTLVGRRQGDRPMGEICYCESPQADYRRMFELGPDVDTSKINAEMRDGVLVLHLPKSEKAKPRRITVQAA